MARPRAALLILPVRRILICAAAILAAAAVSVFVLYRRMEAARAAVQAEVAAARAENTRLREKADRLEKAASDEDAARAAARARQAGGDGASRAAASGTPGLWPGMRSVATLGNAGRASARSALQTQLWAARAGDVALEASSITFSEASRERLRALASALPASLQAEYNTPELLMAYILAGSPHPVGGVQFVSETEVDASDVTIRMQWQHADDDIIHDSSVSLVNGPDGWKLVLPDALVGRAADYLSRSAGGPPKGH